MAILYTAQVKSENGRAGRVRSSDGLLDLRLAAPKGLGGNEDATNPEQLFAAAYAACFSSSVEFLARQQGLSLHGLAVDATVDLRATEAGPFVLDVALAVEFGGLPQAEAESLVQRAHQVCPYSHALRGNVDVKLQTRAL